MGLVGRDPIGVIIDLDRLHEGETGPDGFELWQELQDFTDLRTQPSLKPQVQTASTCYSQSSLMW